VIAAEPFTGGLAANVNADPAEHDIRAAFHADSSLNIRQGRRYGCGA
jgi:hypothetical protein